jgi:hypothetical protein
MMEFLTSFLRLCNDDVSCVAYSASQRKAELWKTWLEVSVTHFGARTWNLLVGSDALS